MPIAIDTQSAIAPAGLKAKPAVADDYMYEFNHPVALPTVDRLGASFQPEVNPTVVATAFLERLARITSSDDTRDERLSDLFLEDGESLSAFWLARLC